jgi:nucleoside-diphosphate-sugar epimerase
MRVLVVGGDSPIGGAFVRRLAERGDTVYATTRRRETAGGSRIYLDLGNATVETAKLPKVDAAFFCAAVSGFALCRSDPAYARKVNVDGTGRLVQRLIDNDAHAVLLSSTAVFDFKTPSVPADAAPSARTLHGQIKAEAERIFLKLGPSGSVLRLTKVLAPNAPLFTQWIVALGRGEPISAFGDLHIAPMSLDDATGAMLAVALDRGAGIYQLSGAYDVSYFDAARHLANVMGASPELVRSIRAINNGVPEAEIPRHTTLESSRLRLLTGRDAPDPYQVLDMVYGPLMANCAARRALAGNS